MAAQHPAWGVVFDCDSTLVSIEGIDELARASGQFAAVEALTQQAMAGEIPLEAVYGQRLERIRPRQSALHALAKQYLQSLLPQALPSVKRLQAAGFEVALVSGGLRLALQPLAEFLGVEALFAVDVDFSPAGDYVGLPPQALCTAKGKAEVLRAWRREKRLARLWMVGDGMSDAEAKAEGAATDFIAFSGVVARPAVLARADAVGDDLLAIAENIMAARTLEQ